MNDAAHNPPQPCSQPCTVSAINRLPAEEKRRIYTLQIPTDLLERFDLPPDLIDAQGNDLVKLICPEGSPSAEISLYHQAGFPDPVMTGHITDTINGQISVLLYVLNDPTSPRFDIDRLPDGSETKFGTAGRNLEAERRALEYGLAPGQIRAGLRLLGRAIDRFEHFVTSIGHELYFIEPLFYHNAVIFERYGFAYERGRRRMEAIHAGFGPGGELRRKLDGSTHFRRPQAADSIRLRSWAIHDGLLGETFTGITMYKRAGRKAGVDTCPGCDW